MPSEPTPKLYPGVMVSSTFTDLEHHRAALLAALPPAGLMPIAMEGSSAQLNDVIDSSLGMVGKASAVILLISHKYGQTPTDPIRNRDALSITELEFNEATRLRRPLLLFLMDDKHPVTAADVEPDPAKRTKLGAFRTRAKTHPETGVPRIYATFDSLEDFRLKAERAVHNLQKVISAAAIAQHPPDPVAMGWSPQADLLALARPPATPSDQSALEDPFVSGLQGEIADKARALLEPCRRLANSPGWSRLPGAAAKFDAAISCSPADLPGNLFRLYSAMLSLATIYEQHQSVTPQSAQDPLDPDIVQPLSDLIVTAAPWLRCFPSVRRQDDEAGAFLTRRELFAPARTVLQASVAENLISAADAAEVGDLLAAGEHPGVIADKAANRGISTVGALVRASAIALTTIYSGAIASDFATRSVLAQAAGRMLQSVESAALALVPADLAAAVRGLIRRDPGSQTGDTAPAPTPPPPNAPSGDLQLRLGEAEAAAIRGNADAAEALLRQIEPECQSIGWARGERRCMVLWGSIGRIRVTHGDLRAALTSYQSALAIAERLAAADPANAEAQRDLSVSHNKIGDIRVTQGDLQAALPSYLSALAIAERLVAADPANAEAQRDLSVSHERIGDIRRSQGDLQAALDSHLSALDIRASLAAANPASAEAQHDLFISHTRIGDICRDQGDLPVALSNYLSALATAERSADPANAQAQRDLSISHNKIGDIRLAQGDLPAALTSYQSALARAESLTATDPANAETQRDLFVSHSKIGDIRLAQGDLPSALASYQSALAIAERLAAADPANALRQHDLATSLHRTALVDPDPTAARRALTRARDLLRRLTALSSTTVAYRDDLAEVEAALARPTP